MASAGACDRLQSSPSPQMPALRPSCTPEGVRSAAGSPRAPAPSGRLCGAFRCRFHPCTGKRTGPSRRGRSAPKWCQLFPNWAARGIPRIENTPTPTPGKLLWRLGWRPIICSGCPSCVGDANTPTPFSYGIKRSKIRGIWHPLCEHRKTDLACWRVDWYLVYDQ
jgi:hypothetical protein